MADPESSSLTFPLFPKLPAELRDQIWREVLPQEVKPLLYIYKTGCWRPEPLHESDAGYDPESRLNFHTVFRPDLVEGTWFELPLAFVSHEARHIALSWLRENGFTKSRLTKDKQCLLFFYPFNQALDAIYVSQKQLIYSILESFDFAPYNGPSVPIESTLRHIAISEETFIDLGTDVSELLLFHSRLETFLILVKIPPDMKPADNSRDEQFWWEFESAYGWSFSWKRDHWVFNARDDGYIGDEGLYRTMQNFTMEMNTSGHDRGRLGGQDVEFTPVLPIKRWNGPV
ncbi:uncharacterized protein F4822DRAFT_419162 [Hypoxylon trugodes]|uniref:uncharacterized protein n=1 Tax=Hypoxylon trugodes TaxID=326681 RepID=UPI0021A00FA0|nr:uncharacterized protein F4822DRAFT_419162 [Hypoxylon trugodes]KAI1384250.1 hypothetical protein F4822DRAFT_419162 [Hypoxylon trugodes]